MKTKSLVLVLLLFGAQCAFAQSDFPAKMQGSWKTATKSGDATIELVGMTSPDKAKVKVTLTGGTLGPPHGSLCMFGTVESVADRQGTGWQIAAPHMRCASYFLTVKPVEGKQRFEGTMTNDFTGQPGTIVLEW